MTTSPDRHSLRLPGYDYSTAGVYFVTICALKRALLFGEIRSGKMIPNSIGDIVESGWLALPERFATVALDAFALMPNHVHGIIVLHKSNRAEASSAPTPPVSAPTLSRVIQTFKSLTWRAVKENLGSSKPLWQRNYYEHIVRSGAVLDSVRRYIDENVARWAFDRENPQMKPQPPREISPWEV